MDQPKGGGGKFARNKDCVLVYICPTPSPGSVADADDLRRTQSLGCLVGAESSSCPVGRRDYSAERDRCRGIVRCLSSGAFGSELSLDVLIRGQGAFNCSVNNLDIDCVSPRVSTNSLASQMDNPDAFDSPDIAPGSLLTTAAAAADPSLCFRDGRSIPSPGSRLQQQQHPSPRQLLVAAGVMTSVSDGSPVSRSTSCPSVAHHVRRQPLLSTGNAPDPADRWRDGLQPHPSQHGRPDLGSRNLQIGSIESDSFNVTTPTEESVDRVSPHYADDPTADVGADFRVEADRFLAAVEKQVTLRESIASAAVAEDADAADAAHGPKAPTEHQQQQQQPMHQRNSLDSVLHENRGVSGGRLSRSLARTKCLQWLNSLDEGD